MRSRDCWASFADDRSSELMEPIMSKLLKAYDRSRVPLYIQVAAVMRQRIERQQWRPGQKISTLVELEREFEVARVTVRQAVDILRQEGLLHCRQGRGTFVAEKSPGRHWLELATDWAILIESIKDNVPKRIKVDRPPAFPELHEGEGTLAPKYRFIRSLQYKDGEPYGIVNLHLARAVFDRDPEAFLTRPALAILASFTDIEVQHAYQTIVIGGASVQTADLLKIALGAPIPPPLQPRRKPRWRPGPQWRRRRSEDPNRGRKRHVLARCWSSPRQKGR